MLYQLSYSRVQADPSKPRHAPFSSTTVRFPSGAAACQSANLLLDQLDEDIIELITIARFERSELLLG
jgi:hypothetical protein